MKNNIYIFCLTILISCSHSNKEEPLGEQNRTSTNVSTPETSISNNYHDSVNFTDKKGLKQGRWETIGWKDKVTKIHTYKNDTLHGYYWQLNDGGFEGFYSKGKREGIFYQWYGSGKLFYSKKYINDSVVWFACYSANVGNLIQVKPIICYKDSTLVEVPHDDKSSLWYSGYFALKQVKDSSKRNYSYPYGIHKTFFKNGQLQSIIDYNNKTIIEYDSLGNIISDTASEMYKRIKMDIFNKD